MKNLLLSATFVVASSICVNAQTTLSQTGGVNGDGFTISCDMVDQNQEPIGIFETSYYRAYTINTPISIGAVKFSGVVVLAQSIPTIAMNVKIYKATSAFPGSYSNMTLVSTGNINLSASQFDANDNPIFDYNEVILNAPVSANSGDIIVVEVNHPTVQFGAFYIGVTSGASTAPGYMKSEECGDTVPADISTLVNGASNKIVIDLVEDDPSSKEEFFNSNFTIYPNPVNDVLNIESKNGIIVNEIIISDLSGKVVKLEKNTTFSNVTDLASGTYFISIESNSGKATSKFIKK